MADMEWTDFFESELEEYLKLSKNLIDRLKLSIPDEKIDSYGGLIESARHFKTFWDRYSSPSWKTPDISIAKDWVAAEWHKDMDNHLTMAFKPNGLVYYGIDFNGRLLDQGSFDLGDLDDSDHENVKHVIERIADARTPDGSSPFQW